MTSSPLLVGFGGIPRSGKDASSDWLVERHGFTKVNMSAAIHELTSRINPIVGYDIVRHRDLVTRRRWRHPLTWLVNPIVRVVEIRYNSLIAEVGFTEAKNNPEVRRLLQDLGPGARDVIDVNIWTNIASRAVQALLAEGRPAVISGLRFRTEIAMVEELGGKAIWVERPGIPAPSGLTETSVTAHDFPHHIDNDSTLGILHSRVERKVFGA